MSAQEQMNRTAEILGSGVERQDDSLEKGGITAAIVLEINSLPGEKLSSFPGAECGDRLSL